MTDISSMATDVSGRVVTSVVTTDVPSNLTNTTTGSQGYVRDETLAKVEISVQAVIVYMALFGNMIVIIYLLRRKRKLSRMQLFIIHLAIADISVALFQVLPQLIMDITYRFDGNDFLCKLVKYFTVVTMYSSTYVLIMTALDRYMSICHPLMAQTWTSRRVNVMTLTAWVLALLFSIPQLFLFSYRKRVDGVYDCLDKFDANWQIEVYVTWIFISLYVVPFLILTGCYSKICYIVWVSANAKENPSKKGKSSKKKNMQDGSSSSPNNIRNPRAHSKKMSKSKMKTVKLTLAVVLCFLFCWAPYFITQVWAAFDPTAPYFTSPVMAITTILASLNSCTNPWIYLAFSGRMCRKTTRAGSKTWTSTTNTFVMDSMTEHSRNRTYLSETTALTRSNTDRKSNRLSEDV